MGLFQVHLAMEAMTSAARPPEEDGAGIDFAWKVHEALSTWTGRVDTKASIVLTLEVATLSFAIALTDGTKLFASLSGWRACVFAIGLALAGFGILAATAVVFPQLARRKARADWQNGFVYFGHLRRWAPVDLESTLEQLTPREVRRALSTQLVTMSKIAWRKHGLLQASVLFGIAAAVAFAVAGIS